MVCDKPFVAFIPILRLLFLFKIYLVKCSNLTFKRNSSTSQRFITSCELYGRDDISLNNLFLGLYYNYLLLQSITLKKKS